MSQPPVGIYFLVCSKVSDEEMYATESVGEPGTHEFTLYLLREGERISIWNDVPLQPQESLYHFVCEVPKGTRQKMEVQTQLAFHPIKQDLIDGQLRQYRYGDMICNYGAMPQTWEDPSHISPHTGAPGDNDPLDLVEIGSGALPLGSVSVVKVLGVLGLIDGGETDWKIIGVRSDDPLAEQLDDIGDVERAQPGLLARLREWLRQYKVVDGKPPNTFAFQEQYRGRDVAVDIIQQCHQAWRSLHAL